MTSTRESSRGCLYWTQKHVRECWSPSPVCCVVYSAGRRGRGVVSACSTRMNDSRPDALLYSQTHNLRLRCSIQYYTNITIFKRENVILAVRIPLILRFTTLEKVHFLEFLPVNSKPWTLEFIFFNTPQLFNRNTCFLQQYYLNRLHRFHIKIFQKLKINFWRVFLPNKGLVLKNFPNNSLYLYFILI